MRMESEPGDYSKTIKCPKCNKTFELHAMHEEMLEGVSDYECPECRGEYDKIKEAEKRKDTESDAA